MKQPKRLFKHLTLPGQPSAHCKANAFHEAGHAVHSIVAGLGLVWVDVRPKKWGDGISWGRTRSADIPNSILVSPDKDPLFAYIVHSLAGVAAEQIIDLDIKIESRSLDKAEAWKFAAFSVCEPTIENGRVLLCQSEQKRNQDQIEALIEFAREAAVKFVEENLAAITAVAEMLERKGRLTADEVRELVKSAGVVLVST
jgi:ATP-dependent Zn protease